MGRDVQWEWPWVVAELLAHQRSVELELDQMLARWERGEMTVTLAGEIADLSEASEALAWARGDFELD